MEQTIIENLAQLTNVSESTLEKFLPVTEYIIGHAVHESMCKGEELTIIDLGIGLLYIRIIGDEIRYKFTPSKYICTTSFLLLYKYGNAVSLLEFVLLGIKITVPVILTGLVSHSIKYLLFV